jgi:hypothetical protein
MKTFAKTLAIAGLFLGTGVLAVPSASANPADSFNVFEGTYPSASACQTEANAQNPNASPAGSFWYCSGDNLWFHDSGNH